MRKHPLAAAIGISLLVVAAFGLGVALLGPSQPGRAFFGGQIGLVEIKGAISDARPALAALDEFRRDADVAAILLRVDSPGGAVGPSQEIYREVQRTAAAKPVVASLGTVAASGGYYVAAACTRIVASPGTITGSVGVISSIPDLEGLLAKLGIRLQVIKSGEMKAAGTPERPLNEAERAMLEAMTKDLYNQFLGDVIEARKLTNDQIKAIADSRILSGRQAREAGLVDELGNFNDALALAARLGNLQGRPRLVEPEPKAGSFWRRFLRDEGRALLAELIGELHASAAPRYLLSLPAREP
ncbi:MAG: signal peptide peptidase SppA [Thermodesulfobacteriota bacterium]